MADLLDYQQEALVLVYNRYGVAEPAVWQQLADMDLIERELCGECEWCEFRGRADSVTGCTVRANRLALARMWRLTKLGHDIMGMLTGWGH